MIPSFPRPRPIVPRPFPVPTTKRPLKGKPMTLVAGFRCSDGGILLCADREESGDGTKRSINKLREWKGKNATFLFGASGTSAIIANLYTRLEVALAENEQDLQTSHVKVIGDVLRSIHKDFEEFDEWPEMVIAASFYQDIATPLTSFLYGTVGSVLEPVAHYTCKGFGKDLGRYFFQRLFDFWPQRRQAVIMATFVFREAEDHLDGVGRGTDMMYLATQQRTVWTVPYEKHISDLEGRIPSLKDTLAQGWDLAIEIPYWLEQSI